MNSSELTLNPIRFPLPLMVHFLERPSMSNNDLTVDETPYQTSSDGIVRIEYIDDEDVAGGATTNTGVNADSDDKEDADSEEDSTYYYPRA